MKKLCLIVLLIAGALSLGPRAGAQGKTLEVYYIAHDHYETRLSDILDQVRRNTRYNPDRTVIFYLANGNKPVRVLVSPDDETEYNSFRETLNSQTSHNVYPEVDRYMLIDMLSEGKYVPAKGLDSYRKVVFNYFITAGFVAMDFCDALIGRLYWDMEMDKIPRNKIEINIFHSPDDRIDEDRLFGRKNLIGNFPVLVDSF
ncbi:MAG: hypothetical protein IKZ91_03885 [Bacteroidales bacterium]|nr:hypothetical protein [Bacteroidales bacterium]